MRLAVTVAVLAAAVVTSGLPDQDVNSEWVAAAREQPTQRQLLPDDEFGDFHLLADEDPGFFPGGKLKRPAAAGKPGRRPRYPTKRRPGKRQREGVEGGAAALVAPGEGKHRGRNNNNYAYRDREGVTGFINAFRRLIDRVI